MSDTSTIEYVYVTAQKPVADTAPVTASLNATEPQAVVNRDYIDHYVPETTDYTNIVTITPSAVGVSANGPGLSEKDATIRGFGDGEYNVTYDGIPFGDTNDPTHHTTSYFPGPTIGTVVVDRGPGNAGNIGQATFGGSVNLFSQAVSHRMGASQSATIGSWATYNFVTKLESGDIDGLGDTRLLGVFTERRSNGALSYAKVDANNQMFKLQSTLAPNVTLTLYGEHNGISYYDPDTDGATLDQVAAYGKGFSMSNDPSQPTYWRYNHTRKQTDFSYARLQAGLGDGFVFDNTTYMYAYVNETYSATDVTTLGSTQSTTWLDGSKHKGDIPGYNKQNAYRVFGDILRMSKDFAFGSVTGQARFGVWWESSATERRRFDYDMTVSNVIDYSSLVANVLKPSKALLIDYNGVPTQTEYLEHSGWDQYQPFLELELHPLPGLTFTPGVRYMSFTRKTHAEVDPKTVQPLAEIEKTFTRTLPFAEVNYKFADNWSSYFEYAQGTLVPPLKIFNVPDPSQDIVKPQTSTNYQIGSVYYADAFTLDGDVYLIEFDNKFATETVGGNKIYFNEGGVTYRGVEAQGTYAFDNGFSVFANGSLNDAKVNATHLQVSGAPMWTAALGLFYTTEAWHVGMITKFVGQQWADDSHALNGIPIYGSNGSEIGAYSITNLTMGYDFGLFAIKGGVHNLFDNRNVTDISFNGPNDPTNQYFFIPERSYELTVKVKI